MTNSLWYGMIQRFALISDNLVFLPALKWMFS